MPLFRGPECALLLNPHQAIGSPWGRSLSHTPRLCINPNKAIEWNRYHNRERRCCFSDCRPNDKGFQEVSADNKQPTDRPHQWFFTTLLQTSLILFLSSTGVSNLNALFQFSRSSLLDNALFGFQILSNIYKISVSLINIFFKF